MSDLVGKPEDRFSCDAAHINFGTKVLQAGSILTDLSTILLQKEFLLTPHLLSVCIMCFFYKKMIQKFRNFTTVDSEIFV